MSSEERSAAVLLLAVVALVPACWLALGWRADLLVGANDLSLLMLPALRRLLAVHGDFDAFLYDPAWLGGSKLRDILGALPLHRLLAQLPIDAITLLNVTVMFAQVLFGYLSARAARAVCTLIAPERTVAFASQLAIALGSAFVPVMAWRIGYGHVFILLGALALPAACTLVLLSRAGQLTFVCMAVALAALLHALPHVGLQPVLYGAVFGAPLLVGYWRLDSVRGEPGLRALVPMLVAIVGALLVSLPVLHGLLAQFSGADAPRGFATQPVTYSYLVASAADWLYSLFWNVPGALSGRSRFAWHETNYPLGPMLLGLCLVSKRTQSVAIGFGLSLVLVLVFSMDVRPVSSWLVAALPPLGLFRVPARAGLPLILAVAPFLFGLVLTRLPANFGRRDLALVLVAGVCLLTHGYAREAVLWASAVIALVLASRDPARAASAPALLLLFALGSLLAFQQRLLAFPSRAELIQQPMAAGAAVRARFPELESPLARVVSTPQFAPNNTLYQLGLSALSGYNLLNQRFVRLYCALLGDPYQPNVSLVSLDPAAAYFPKAAALYNIVVSLDLRAKPARAMRLPPRGRPLWFGEKLLAQPGYRQLVAALGDDVRRVIPFVASDPATRDLPPLACQVPVVEMAYSVSSGPSLLQVQLDQPRSGLCPLVIAMNYVSDFIALGRGPLGVRALRTFPAYGALLGVIVPANVTQLEIAVRSQPPWWSLASAAIGGILLLALLLWTRRTLARV